MAFSINNWNINPNRLWYVRIEDVSGVLTIGLYLTQADAGASTNCQAVYTAAAFGSDLEITLEEEAGASVAISLHQETDEWHLVVSGSADDDTKIFQIKSFIDLDDIQHPIYRNPLLVTRRATAEINAHTHVDIERHLDMAIHLPTLEPGEIVSITSDRRGLSADLCQVREHLITGTPDRLTSRLLVTKYQAIKR